MPDAQSVTTETTSRRIDWLWISALIAVIAFPLLYLAQSPFVLDEPMLLQRALEGNQAHHLATSGLAGSYGRRYGPVPVWIYQAILCLTHDPVAIMMIHIVLISASVTLGLAWIGRTMGFWKWGLLALAMSPHVWINSRLLWDNNFNIALGVWCVGAYAAFLKHRSAPPLMLAIFLAGVMLLVHLMAASLFAAIFFHLGVARRGDLKRFWRHALVAVLLAAIVGTGYAIELFQVAKGESLSPAPALNSWWFALLGPRVLSAAWMEYFFTGSWLHQGGLWSVAFLSFRMIALLAFPLTWLGLLIGVKTLMARRSDRDQALDPAGDLTSFCVVAVACQVVLNIATRTFGHPHYYNANWAVFAVAMWLGLDYLARRSWGRTIGWLQTISVSGICMLLLGRVVSTGGTRDLRFGPTLANKLEVLRDRSRYAQNSPVRLDVQVMHQSFEVLAILRPCPRNGSPPLKSLAVKYASNNPNDGHVKLVEATE